MREFYDDEGAIELEINSKAEPDDGKIANVKLTAWFMEQISNSGIDLRLNVWMSQQHDPQSSMTAEAAAELKKPRSGPELAAALARVSLSDEDRRAWQSDLKAARKALNTFACQQLDD